MTGSIGSRRNRFRFPRTHKRTIVFASGLMVAWLAIAPGVADAHAIVEETEPGIDQVVEQSPERVLMRFNEPVEIAFGAVRVYNTDAERVDEGETTHPGGHGDEIQVGLRPDLPKGTYTVAWKVVSADGHPIEEAFVFHVKEPGEHPEGLGRRLLNGAGGAGPAVATTFAIVRMINFAGLLVLCGGLVFLGGIWLRVLPAGSSRRLQERFAQRARTVIVGAWIVVVIASIAAVILQGATAGDMSMGRAMSGAVIGDVLHTRFGVVMIVKTVALVVVAILGIVRIRGAVPAVAARSAGAAMHRAQLPNWVLVVGGLSALVLVASPGLAGHAGTTPPIWANVTTDLLHVAAGAVWIGGLVLLLFAAFPAIKDLDEREAVGVMAPVVARFSDMAVVAVGVIVLTGVYRSWVEVGALRALTGSTYGWVLLAKVGTVIPLVALGAINNRWSKPRLERAVAEGASGGRSALSMLRRVIATEVTVAVIVIGLTAFLVNLPPAKVEAGVAGPFTTDIALGNNRVDVIVDPNEVGANEVHLTVTKSNGAPANIKGMSVLFRMPSEDIGPIPAEGRRLAPGHFVVQGRQLSVPGEWQLEIVARTGPFGDERATLSLIVN